MKLSVLYKDMTIETLNEPDFLDQVKKAYPETNWDRVHKESVAAGESENT